MKCSIPEVSWHNRDPVLSVDIQPIYNEDFYRLASGGADCHVLIWHLKSQENGAVNIDVVSDLTRHQRAVNVVRWSPSGQYLASGDDDANIIIWCLKTDNIPLLEGETGDKEIWLVHKILRGHKEDVYDICWAPNGLKLVSGSIDNTAILWDFTKGQNECILSDHKGFVQGVTWDPKGQFIATLSSDRICRIFDSTGRTVKGRAYKGILPVPDSHLLANKEVKYFHDDTFKSYFRRLNFSPDGSLLIAPSGCIDEDDYNEIRHATFIFTLDSLIQPVAMLPSPKQVTIAARCCPILFELHTEGIDPIITLPYRMIIAVATDSDVILYDTQQLAPFAHFRKIHYTRITDLTWSSDGLLLMASSTDGFCTFITFEPDELGIQYTKEDSETEITSMDISGCEELEKTDTSKKKKEKETDAKIRKPTILEQWAVRKPKNDLEENDPLNITKSDIASSSTAQNVDLTSSTNTKEPAKSVCNIQKKLVPKRIIPTKIAEIEKPTSNAKTEKGDKDAHGSTLKNRAGTSTYSKNDVIVIDDASPNTSEISPHNNKGQTIKRKRNIESKQSPAASKNTSLLNFFQVGAAEKKTAESKRTNDKDKSKNGTEIVSVETIEIIDDDSTDKVASEATSSKITETLVKVEDSEEGTHASEHIANQISITDNPKKTEEIDEAKNTTSKTTATEKENVEEKLPLESANSGTCSSLTKTSVTKSIKTHRRIPFVTLSSPKRKKKE